MKLFFWISLLYSACATSSSDSKISIYNASNLTVDSAIVEINNHKVWFEKIKAGERVSKIFNRDSVIAKHDVTYSCTFSIKDAKIKETFFSNDLGYVPPEFKIRINDSLMLTLEN